MKDFVKGKFFTVLTVIVTIVLAGVAIFTAVKLYQLGQEPVAPTAPASKPEASEPETISCKQLEFSIKTDDDPEEEVSPTLSPTLTPTLTLTPTPSDTPIGGNDPSPTLTPSPQASSTTTPTSTPTPTSQPLAQNTSGIDGQILPDAGISTPTIFGLLLGILLITAALVLAI